MVIVLPAALLLSTLTMSLFRGLPADAHMGPLRVVEAYNAGKFHLAEISGRDGHLIEPLALEDTVGALRDGILQWITALGHTDADAMALELGHICIAAVLAAAV